MPKELTPGGNCRGCETYVDHWTGRYDVQRGDWLCHPCKAAAVAAAQREAEQRLEADRLYAVRLQAELDESESSHHSAVEEWWEDLSEPAQPARPAGSPVAGYGRGWYEDRPRAGGPGPAGRGDGQRGGQAPHWGERAPPCWPAEEPRRTPTAAWAKACWAASSAVKSRGIMGLVVGRSGQKTFSPLAWRRRHSSRARSSLSCAEWLAHAVFASSM